MEATLRKQNPINITRLIATTFRLEDSTPPDLLTPLRQRAALGAPGVSSPLSGGDEAAAKVIMENVAVSPDPWPLPIGYYPAFDGYPKYVVDYQLRERARIAIEEEEIRRKRDYMDAISKKTEEVARAEQVRPGADIIWAAVVCASALLPGLPVCTMLCLSPRRV